MGTLIMVGQLILSLSILIVLHEMGHFFPARWFNTRVEKFYLFFDPWFSLFKIKKGDTEYGIGWLPLGGYVKISGMMDESFDKEQLAQEPQPWEFRSKPAWQRLIIMLGGVTVNFILGFFVWAMVLFVWGDPYIPAENVTHGIGASEIAQEMGLRDGDHIIKIGETPFDIFDERTLRTDLALNGVNNITVKRAGAIQNINIDPKFKTQLLNSKAVKQSLIWPNLPFVGGFYSKRWNCGKFSIKKRGSNYWF